ncbi:MAG: hypothetical protein KJ687_07340, partial [Proteobacteria bacterium]|nr:hypothetical protein [Pseudomonadota bacterium]
MKLFSPTLKRFLFSGKVQGPGSYGLHKIVAVAFKAFKIKGPKPLLSYLFFLLKRGPIRLSSKPFVMVCYVNSECNLNCPYCCYGVPQSSRL